MKYVKSFGEFVNENNSVNEARKQKVKIPRRIKNKSDIGDYFWGSDKEHAMELWSKGNTSAVLQANNGKHYWVEKVWKDFGNEWLQLKIAKPHPSKPGKFLP